MTSLPILQVIVPLVSAPVLRRSGLIWVLAILLGSIAFVISVVINHLVIGTGVLAYTPGAWLTSLGIEFQIDRLSSYILPVITGVSTLILVSSFPLVRKELSEGNRKKFYISFLLCLAGLLGVIASSDLVSMIIFFEISAFSSYILISLGSDRRALMASYQYFIMGTIGTLLILAGAGLLYMQAGSLNMNSLATSIAGLADLRMTGIAAGLLISGICLKLAVFPFHLWLADIYRHAPSVASAFLATVVTPVFVYVLIRVIYSVLGPSFSLSRLPLQDIFLVLGFAGIIITSLTAIYQENVRDILAYITVAQISYLIVGFSMGNATGLTGSLLQLFSLVLVNGTLFLVICAVINQLGRTDLESFSGLGKYMPWTVSAIGVGGLSLTGVPLTAGFISKWYLILAAVENGWIIAGILILIGSLLAAVCIWRIIEVACFKPSSPAAEHAVEAPLTILIPLWVLVLSNIYFGIDTRLTVGTAQLVSQSFFGTSP